MKYDKELIQIVKNKNFKTFWHCLDFLILAGYTPMDAFGISLQEFKELNIFSSVAFVRIEGGSSDNDYLRHSIREHGLRFPPIDPKYSIIVGLIDDSNVHLSGLYATYNNWLHKGKFDSASELESTCEIIQISNITGFLVAFLDSVSEKHFGYKIFRTSEKIRPIDTYIPPNLGLPNHDDMMRQINQYMGIPREDIERNEKFNRLERREEKILKNLIK